MQLDNAYLALKRQRHRTWCSTEENVNAYELNIDRRCEDFITLYQPVASTLLPC
jgi:phosphate uptake regulator